MLNQVKSVGYGFSLFPRLFSFVFVGKLAFLSAVFLDINSLALKALSVASIDFRVSASLGRLAQSEAYF
ncbi:hypothetical protein QPB16_004357 [Vibrio vulnificus]|nr:hypothetical protein [Vibrio vulnificus]